MAFHDSLNKTFVARAASAGPARRLLNTSVRLQTVAALFGAFWTIGLLKVALSGYLRETAERIGMIDPAGFDRVVLVAGVLSCVAVVLSVVVFALARSRALSEHHLLMTGLFFGVAGAYLIAFSEVQVPIATLPMRGPSWTGVWLLLFPMVAPASVGRVAVALLVAIPAINIATWTMTWTGLPMPDPVIFWASLAMHTFLGAMALAPVAVYSAMKARLHAAETEALRLGSYQLKKKLGSGGMGEVWIAHHDMLSRPAALKVISPDVLGSDLDNARARFEREAQATAELQSPHTVDLFDFGITPDGRLYYAMELLAGIDLGTLVQRYGPVPPERAIFMLLQVCDSLGEAHDHHLVHRDIKPENLVVCQFGRSMDFVKVLDFGLVSRECEFEGGIELTARGMIQGTPGFMAPEIARGDPLDGRADLYALGCVAWWLLTGRLLFERDTPMKTVLAHIEDPPPWDTLDREFDVHPQLKALLERMLAKCPDDRPAHADDVAAALREVDVDDPWSRPRAARWWHTHRPIGGSAEGHS